MTRGVKKYRIIKARYKRLRFSIRAQGHVISVHIHKAKAHQLRGHHEIYVCYCVVLYGQGACVNFDGSKYGKYVHSVVWS